MHLGECYFSKHCVFPEIDYCVHRRRLLVFLFDFSWEIGITLFKVCLDLVTFAVQDRFFFFFNCHYL